MNSHQTPVGKPVAVPYFYTLPIDIEFNIVLYYPLLRFAAKELLVILVFTFSFTFPCSSLLFFYYGRGCLLHAFFFSRLVYVTGPEIKIDWQNVPQN